jgi:hypothetical protein
MRISGRKTEGVSMAGSSMLTWPEDVVKQMVERDPGTIMGLPGERTGGHMTAEDRTIAEMSAPGMRLVTLTQLAPLPLGGAGLWNSEAEAEPKSGTGRGAMLSMIAAAGGRSGTLSTETGVSAT